MHFYLFSHMTLSPGQGTLQPIPFINYSITQFINSSITQLLNYSITQFINYSIHQLLNSSIILSSPKLICSRDPVIP